jgi:murein DD-endopeptidase MepM/ murein hydrolase activator NlpD
MNTEPGDYIMTLRYQKKGEPKKLEMPFTVIPGGFSEEDTADLDISILTEETLEMLKYEGNYFARAYSRNPDSILYDGNFIWPCSGTITGLFGTPRRYNKDLDKWSHKAVDIGNVVGTKVYAPNHGVVVMAKNLEVHGKSIVIAHGKRIHTIYIHLDSICVEKGDKVKKGQFMAELGRTGLCTGPNLHWGFVVNRVHVDPRYWIKGKPEIKKGQWIQYKKPED